MRPTTTTTNKHSWNATLKCKFRFELLSEHTSNVTLFVNRIRSRFKDDGTIQITTVNGTAPVDGIPALTLSPRKSSLKPPRQNAYPSPVDTEMNMIEENNGEDNDNNNNNSTTTTTTTNVVGGRRKSMVTFNEKTEIRVTNF